MDGNHHSILLRIFNYYIDFVLSIIIIIYLSIIMVGGIDLNELVFVCCFCLCLPVVTMTREKDDGRLNKGKERRRDKQNVEDVVHPHTTVFD